MYRKSLHIIFIFFVVISLHAQDDSGEDVESEQVYSKEELLQEQRFLNFEKFLIEAVTQRNNQNYDKALESLRVCENIYPNNVAMLFEKAKNHFALKQYPETMYYCQKALDIEIANYWILDLLKETFIKQYNYPKAIETAKRMYVIDKIAAADLLRLYYYTNNIPEGKALLKEVDKNNIYITALDFYKKKFNPKEKTIEGLDDDVDKENTKSIQELQQLFLLQKSYKTLILLLEKEQVANDYKSLLKDSEKGLVLFPAQAKVYYYNGLANNASQKYDKAIGVLETGLDYIIEDADLKKDFYKALIISYAALKNTRKENQYKQMVQKL